jgi:hypothetical protein
MVMQVLEFDAEEQRRLHAAQVMPTHHFALEQVFAYADVC